MEPKTLEEMLDSMGDTITLSSPTDTITLSNTTYGYPNGFDYANTTLTTSAVTGAISGTTYPNIAPITITSGTGISSPWATTTTATPWLGNGISTDGNGSGRLTLNGENADIEVNGESLIGLLKDISERLNILRPNEKMEKEWDQLRELGEQYRALEAKLKEQGAMWEKLKAMPPPDIG